jgi:exodeoxyribonuclease VII large subunit
MLAQPKILTVSELTRDLKEVLENVFEEVHVEGEISNLRQPASGHCYFSLKDESSQLKCVLFKGAGAKIKFSLKDGMKAICSGRIGVYEKDGQYQLYVAAVEPKGKGALQLAFEQLKERLSKEGLFDEAHKKPLPFLPQAIGVVTSPTGAVIRDILHVLNRRFEGAHVVIHPARVQGDDAAQEIASAIQCFNDLKNVDVIILARGGGSLEDLWCFNEELVARAIYASLIPVISAVGHETDYTIADFTADRRAPTPSAAAEIVMPPYAELNERISSRLVFLWQYLKDIVPQYAQRIDDLTEDLSRAMERLLETLQARLGGLMDQLIALNPLAILKRGYSITYRLEDAKAVVSARDLKKGDKVRTRLSQGGFTSEVLEIS